jgi:broad specificity phosphatase PhoE
MTRLYLIRHGETEWNRLEKTQGCADISLSENGYIQAGRLARRLLDEGIEAVYSSDLRRAFTTARIIAEQLDIEVHTHPGLREMNFGCWEGLDFHRIKKEYTEIHRLWLSSPDKAIIPGAEELIEVQNRATDAVKGIVELNRGRRIAIVSHGVTLKCLIFGLLGIDLGNLSKIRLDNCSLTIIEYRNGRYVLDLMNDICHVAG